MNQPLSTLLAPSSARADTLPRAYALCLKLCRSHYENFPVASRWIPSERRGPVAAVYAFARVADDFADEPGWEPRERLRLLADWRARLRNCRANHDQHAVFWALSDTLARFRLTPEPFERLVTAFEMDVTKKRHATFEEVLFYCHHSADPVGELVLRLFGEWTEERGAWSNAICTALQLANFWQDVTVDARKDRLYVPLEDLKSLGVSEREVLNGPVSGALRELMARQVDRTWSLFRRGRRLCDDVSPALRKELRLVWLGGTRILEKIEARKYDVWSHRPSLNKGDWFRLLVRCFLWKENASGA